MLEKIFLYCSGANRKILEQCPPSEKDKYVALGLTVLGTSVLAGCSGGYAVFTIFESAKIASAVGSLWGFFIFNIDRAFILNMKKEKNNWKKAAKVVIPRLILASFLGLLVSKPLELRFFAKEIGQKIEEEQLLRLDKLKQQKSENQQIAQLETRNQQLEQNLRDKEDNCQNFYQEMIGEAEGVTGSGKQGKGLVYEDKKHRYDQCQKDLEIYQSLVQTEIKQNNGTIQSLNQSIEQEVNSLKTEGLPSIFQQLVILHELSRQEPSIAVIDLVITLSFVIIEISPVLLKLLSPYSSYDASLQEKEESLIDYYEKNLADLKQQNDERIKLRQEIRQTFWQEAGSQIKNLMSDQFAEVIKKLQQEPELMIAQQSVIAELVKRIRTELTRIVESISISQIVDRQSTQKNLNQFTRQYVQQHQDEMAEEAAVNNSFDVLHQDIKSFEQEVDQFTNNGHVKKTVETSNSKHS